MIYDLTPSMATVGAAGGTVTFTGSVTGDAGESLLGYDVFFDVSGVDLNAGPGPVVINNLAPLAFGPSFFSTLNPGGGGRDFGISNTGLFTSLDTTGGLDLFTFDAVFQPNPGPALDFNIDFTPAAPGFSTVLAGNVPVDLGTVGFNGATVTLEGATAVPEPSSVALLGIAVAVCVVRQRKRKASRLQTD